VNITNWSAVSGYGHGRAAFTAGVLAARRTDTPIDPARWQVPDARACLVPQFDPRTALGRKGTRTMNRVTGLAVAAVGELAARTGRDADGATATATAGAATGKPGDLDELDGPDGFEAEPLGGGTALVLGTTTGSVQSMMDFTRASVTGERPFDVEPGLIPNSVLNCAAAQCAIWHQMQGPNTTLAGGRASGLLALAYARRLLLLGRAEAALCGGAEEYSPARSWLEHHSRGGTPALLGEGAAVVRVQLADGPGTLASILALESMVSRPGQDEADMVKTTVRRALERAGVARSQVWAAAAGGSGTGERLALARLFGSAALDRVPNTADLLGDTGAVSATFQLIAILVAGQAAADDADDSASPVSGSAGPGRIAVLSCVEPDGATAAAVLRLGPNR
jgi:3-oxoacyl-[acyl-carrier-protein] synthase II